MRTVFADTGYWIALLDRNDLLHAKAQVVSRTLSPVHIVTSSMVLTELLNYFAARGVAFRTMIAQFISEMQRDENVTITPQSQRQFDEALKLYAQRLDKQWSLTDCASFPIMANQDIAQVLAYDIHFQQAGFVPLLRGD